MTQKEKNLLLRDLSTRLVDGVICQVDDGLAGLNDGKLVEINIQKELLRFEADGYWDAYIEDVKPYLRPLSSMTEEEKIDYQAFFNYDGVEYPDEYIDWLNKKKFAYRTIDGKDMFELGLAIVAPERMYNIK